MERSFIYILYLNLPLQRIQFNETLYQHIAFRVIGLDSFNAPKFKELPYYFQTFLDSCRIYKNTHERIFMNALKELEVNLFLLSVFNIPIDLYTYITWKHRTNFVFNILYLKAFSYLCMTLKFMALTFYLIMYTDVKTKTSYYHILCFSR